MDGDSDTRIASEEAAVRGAGTTAPPLGSFPPSGARRGAGGGGAGGTAPPPGVRSPVVPRGDAAAMAGPALVSVATARSRRRGGSVHPPVT